MCGIVSALDSRLVDADRMILRLPEYRLCTLY